MLLFLPNRKLSSHREEEQQEYILVEPRPSIEKEESSQIIQFSKEVREMD